MILLTCSSMGFVRDRWKQYVYRPYDLYCMCAAPPVSPNSRMSSTLGLRAESAYGGGIQSIRYRPSTPRSLYHMLSKIVTYDLVHAALHTLNIGYAPGVAGCGPEICQHFHHHCVPRMIRIVQDFESTGSLPDNWSVAPLNPIPETVGISTSGGLRPLFLQNSALKWATPTMLLQLKDLIIYLTPPEHRGFVPGRNMNNHLFEVHASWRTMESGLFVPVDCAKAFDSVWHVYASAFFRKMGLPPGRTHMLLFLFQVLVRLILPVGIYQGHDFLPKSGV